jgi:hypothetical protein
MSIAAGFYKQRCRQQFFLVLLFGLASIFLTTGLGMASATAMRGPESKVARQSGASPDIEASSVRLAFKGLIRSYQMTASRVGGDRCGFRPSCSAFGLEAVHHHGPVLGVIITADRLMRDHPGLRWSRTYTPLPGGKFHDPAPENLLLE